MPRILTLEAEVERTTEINNLKDYETEIKEYVQNLAGIINDFRLVFPVDEVSTISIYREEVNEEYFAPADHDADDELVPVPDAAK